MYTLVWMFSSGAGGNVELFDDLLKRRYLLFGAAQDEMFVVVGHQHSGVAGQQILQRSIDGAQVAVLDGDDFLHAILREQQPGAGQGDEKFFHSASPF